MNELSLELIRAADYAKRKALIDLYFSSPVVTHVHMLVQVLHPETRTPMWNVPLNLLDEEGRITLNISPSAVGHFAHTENETVLEVRFNGKPERLMFDSGLVVALIAYNGQTAVHSEVSAMLFYPVADAQDITPAKPAAERPALKLVK